MTDETKVEVLEGALKAIRARINGVFDDPDLLSFGPLDVRPTNDILHIVSRALWEINNV